MPLYSNCNIYFGRNQSQQLQMLPMSNPNVSPGSVETQQMRIVAPVGVSSVYDLIGDLNFNIDVE